VPGGAFWMGTSDTLLDALPFQDALGPHLVVLSPFFLTTHEVTVATVRAARTRPRVIWSGQKSGRTVQDFCTFSSSAGANEDLPANCLLWDEAATVCESMNAELPTEAQYEYVAGHFEARRFVWGQDAPECGDAVFGRGGWGIFEAADAPCKTKAPPGGVALGGQSARDRLELPTGTIVDIAGNVAEWARDNWNRHDERCWSSPRVYRDPLCMRPTKDAFDHPARGGEWLVLSGQLTRSTRTGASSITATPEVGFRCARPGRE
jgi:formylglycine-generating enzyme required for sulfatase activity